jgi:hypothetical protein
MSPPAQQSAVAGQSAALACILLLFTSTARAQPAQALQDSSNELYFCGGTIYAPSLPNPIYVSADGTDSATCGKSLASQCATIQQGITNCSEPPCSVVVASDRYRLDRSIVLANGVSVYGGCEMTFIPTRGIVSVVYAPPKGAPAVVATRISSPTMFRSFTIIGSAAEAGSTASIAFVANESTPLTLISLTLRGGRGAVGARGSDGQKGRQGDNATGQSGATNRCTTPTYGGDGGDSGNAKRRETNAGLPGMPGNTEMAAKGGNPGSSVEYSFGQTKRPGPAENGDSAHNALCGRRGRASRDVAGAIVNGTWVPSVGGAGGNGGDGGGGGGGGSGGNCVFRNGLGHLQYYDGVAGGGGGAGGCGGTGGRGGQQGGASIALLINGGGVEYRSGSILPGAGGDGGSGGDGYYGDTGGSGAQAPSKNPCNEKGGAGGRGGYGGIGGDGSGGAGGNGGPAFAIAITSGSGYGGSATFFSGLPGNPGVGGRAVRPISPHCNGEPGEPGQIGASERVHQY